MASLLWRWLLSAGTLGALALGWYAYDQAIKPPRAAEPPSPRELAYVAGEVKLSEDESLRLVIVPHPLGKAFDVRCLIYRDRTHGAQFVCPNASQEQLEGREMTDWQKGIR